MGRHAGWLTAAAALADVANVDVPYLIYLEERPFSIDRFIDDLNAKLKDYDAVMIAVSEGVHDENGVFICESVAASKGVDVFGHVQLSGTGKILENAIRDRIGCKVRSIELNLLQRCASHILSATDIEESMLLGENAVKLAVSRQSGLMSSLRRVSDSPYRVVYEGVDIQKVANAEKKIPQNWINKAGNNVTQECINYLRPLVAGEMTCKFKDGVPDYMILK
jgi:6-phosphofructokinase 1